MGILGEYPGAQEPFSNQAGTNPPRVEFDPGEQASAAHFADQRIVHAIHCLFIAVWGGMHRVEQIDAAAPCHIGAPMTPSKALLIGIVVALAGTTAKSQVAQVPRLETNEAYVEELTRESTLAISDPLSVFSFVLKSLPERVKVYPTENYYYFRFLHQGTRYAGNIRLDPRDRDRGKVQFAYYRDLSEWMNITAEAEVPAIEADFDGSHNVTVEKLEALAYRVSYDGKSVTFMLNDLSQVKPPPGARGPDEKFLGPVFDESAIRFFLIYNSRLKLFHYVLDETARLPEDWIKSTHTDRILIGRRTGFAVYRDHRLDRKILIGAFELNSLMNNYFDGPFDQLPENFIEGDALRDTIIDTDPTVKGKIDRLGFSSDGSGRYAIHPYMLYRKESDLYVAHRCATTKAARAADYYRCFDFDADSRVVNKAAPRSRKK